MLEKMSSTFSFGHSTTTGLLKFPLSDTFTQLCCIANHAKGSQLSIQCCSLILDYNDRHYCNDHHMAEDSHTKRPITKHPITVQ